MTPLRPERFQGCSLHICRYSYHPMQSILHDTDFLASHLDVCPDEDAAIVFFRHDVCCTEDPGYLYKFLPHELGFISPGRLEWRPLRSTARLREQVEEVEVRHARRLRIFHIGRSSQALIPLPVAYDKEEDCHEYDATTAEEEDDQDNRRGVKRKKEEDFLYEMDAADEFVLEKFSSPVPEQGINEFIRNRLRNAPKRQK
ncbi:hypothetical protein CAPTEDRAFT_199508 [Capitella teleta]|uniref:Uncharacterized protein n=1 Tax=Capitella teleta TaxID=283909 RepID=R7TRR3_CAPTE|nr:hypothetical protein CAPTEDRAFT_199508 [Capitella teleta]|eukprot:ELT94191.1 hypothetical protein CAPTEDRAFT_199508 [Capitella teleta]